MKLEQILKQWKQSKSVRLSHQLKRELNAAHLEAFGEGVNTSCGSCVTRALNRLVARMQPEPKPDPINETVAIDFDSMTFKELQSYARQNGIPVRRSRAAQLEELKSK